MLAAIALRTCALGEETEGHGMRASGIRRTGGTVHQLAIIAQPAAKDVPLFFVSIAAHVAGEGACCKARNLVALRTLVRA